MRILVKFKGHFEPEEMGAGREGGRGGEERGGEEGGKTHWFM